MKARRRITVKPTEAAEPSRRPVRIVTWALLASVAVAVLGAVVSVLRAEPADQGALTEPRHDRPSSVPTADLSVETAAWGLTDIELGGADPLSGGATLVDLDNDGDLDLLAANGSAVVLRWDDDRFAPPIDLGVDDAVSAMAADIDNDGWIDILIARTGEADRIVWGGPWIEDGQEPGEREDVAGGNPSSILVPADLGGDGRLEIVRLGRGGRSGSTDVIWSGDASDSRSFQATTLPDSDRLSLAGAIADVDHDGLLDIWVTRDVGWDLGGDALYSRQGNLAGPWVDIADELGTALAIDGMGVTLADLDEDSRLDAYVSDIGDNEILVADGDVFVTLDGTGAARIRPPRTPDDVVSSSWASGAIDVNLDGTLDLIVVGGGFPESTVRNKVTGTSVAVAEPPAVLVGIGNGRYVDDWLRVGLDLSLVARSMTLGDIDADGDTDAIIVTRSGRLVALRNESVRPSLTVKIAAGCGAGVVVTVATAQTTFTSLVPAQTYGGAHAREIIVGTGGEAATITVSRPGENSIERSMPPVDGRATAVIDC